LSGFNILGEDEPKEKKTKGQSVFRDVVWIWEIPSSHLVALIAQAVRKQLDTVENYAQFVARRLQEMGIVVEVYSSMTPITDGYTLTVSFRVRGVRKNVLEKRFKVVRRLAKEITKASSRYKRVQELLERLRAYESEHTSETGNSSSRTSLQEATGEGGEVEDEGARPYTEGNN